MSSNIASNDECSNNINMILLTMRRKDDNNDNTTTFSPNIASNNKYSNDTSAILLDKIASVTIITLFIITSYTRI